MLAAEWTDGRQKREGAVRGRSLEAVGSGSIKHTRNERATRGKPST